ncbi:MAG: Spy0128 family protein [Ruminococcus sp.]
MDNGKLTKLMARASTAIILAFMTAISSISVIAVNTEKSDIGANSDVVESGAQLTKDKDYYLIGTFNNWAMSDSNWKLTNTDGNCYTGTFTLTGSATNYQFKVYNSDGNYYSANGYWFNSSNTVATGLSTSNTNNDQIQCIETSGTITLSVKLYCEYSGDSRLEITQSVSGSGEVTEITKGNTTDSKEYNANVDIENQTSGTEIISVNGSFYDYYMDEEIKDNGRWRSSLTGYYRSVEDSDENKNNAAREPYEYFNRALGEYSSMNSSWSYPLYFGNFYGKSNDYTGRGLGGLKKFKIRPNDSNATTSTVNGSVSALADTTLNSDGMLTANGVTLPYFDSEWLTTNGYGTVINSPFPMRKSQTSKGNDYFEFDSNNGKDNCYFSGYSTNQFTMNYAYNTNKVKDALSGFSSDSDGYGFFPFDRSSEHSGNAYDFGFGMRLDIDFTLGENGTIGSGSSKENTQFTFSGDDDLWVYLDGVLVLDMGGDHKKSSGCIDFAEKKSYVNNIDTSYKADKENALNYVADTSVSGYGYSAEFPKLFSNSTETYSLGSSEFNNNNPNEKHTLTVFYMERGMIESNLKVGFNFSPVKDSFTTTKTVDASGVNALLQDEVEDLDSFGYTVKNQPALGGSLADISNKNYTFSDSSDGHSYYAVTDGNSFSLANGDKAVFSEQFEPESYLQVTENDTPKDTKVTLNSDRLIFFDPSGCTWFGDDGAVPAIAQDYDGTTPSKYSAMSSYEVDGKTYYYYPISDSTTTFTIARKTANGIYNRFKFNVEQDSNGKITDKNYIRSGSVWNGDTDGQNTCPTYSSSDSKGTTYTQFSHTYPDTTQSVIKTSNRSKVVYSPSWSLYDVSKDTEASQSNLVDSGTGETAYFQYFNSDQDEMLSTHMLLSYVNTVLTKDITVNKEVVDENGNVLTSDDTQFTVKLLIDLDNDGTFEDYGLTGTISQSTPYVFEKIPQGVDYQIVEEDSNGYTNLTGVIEGTLSDNATYTFTNRKEQAKYTPAVTKTLDGENYYGEKFTFTLEGMESIKLGDDETQDTSGMPAENITKIPSEDPGKVAFESITYSDEGIYLYKITEGSVNDTDYQTDSDTIILKIVISRNEDNTLSLTPTYYKGNLNDYINDSNQSDYVTFDYESFMVDGNSTDTPTFENISTPGSVTINKTDGNDNALEGVTFALYEVGDDGEDVSELTPTAETTSDENGVAKFDNLAIFTDDSKNSNDNGITDYSKSYQWYCVKEVSTKEGHIKDPEVKYFCLPMEDSTTGEMKYSITLDYVNPVITVPMASGTPTTFFMILGLCIVGLSLFSGGCYIVSTRRRKNVNCRHGR